MISLHFYYDKSCIVYLLVMMNSHENDLGQIGTGNIYA